MNKKQIIEILNTALKTGGDFSELFFEDKIQKTYEFENGLVSSSNITNTYGCGVRILKGDKSVYGYTNDVSFKNLIKLANSLNSSFEGKQTVFVTELKKQKNAKINKFEKDYDKVPFERQLALIKEGYDAAKNYDPRIVKVDIGYFHNTQNVTICNSNGKICEESRTRARCTCTSIASDGKSFQVGGARPGASDGFEFFEDKINLKAMFTDASRQAMAMLTAKECPSGEMTVIIDNAFGGVIFHEACGHSLEATSVAKGLSVFCGKKGTQIASPIVNAVDDGTIPNGWGSGDFDDEGNKTRRNQLIKNGILTSYLVDDFNGRKMGEPGNGACRRESYKYEPTSRMSNTFIENGTSTKEEIFAATKFGLYAAHLGGGSVNPATGDFNFSVLEGYLVEDGKITTPVKGATIIGNGSSILFNIDMIANNLLRDQGMCGSLSGSIPADVGQPTIRVKSILVGGTGGKLK